MDITNKSKDKGSEEKKYIYLCPHCKSKDKKMDFSKPVTVVGNFVLYILYTTLINK